MPVTESTGYVYLDVPPAEEMRSCIGLVLAGMVTRARIGVGGLEEAVELLESLHSGDETTRYRFSLGEDRVVAEIEDDSIGSSGESSWRTVVELAS